MDKRVDLSTFDNSSFDHGASRVKIILWYLISALFISNPLNLSSSIKIFLLRLFGARIGKGVMVKQGVIIKYPWRLQIGDHVWIGENVWIDNLVQVTIGSNSCLSQGAMLLTGNHNYKSTSFELVTGTIILDEGVWIGAKAIVCPGVICHAYSVLTVGSVASAALSPSLIYQGNPAAAKRNRWDNQEIISSGEMPE